MNKHLLTNKFQAQIYKLIREVFGYYYYHIFKHMSNEN